MNYVAMSCLHSKWVFHFGVQDRYEFISGSLKTWHCNVFNFSLELKFHVNSFIDYRCIFSTSCKYLNILLEQITMAYLRFVLTTFRSRIGFGDFEWYSKGTSPRRNPCEHQVKTKSILFHLSFFHSVINISSQSIVIEL